MIRFAWNVTRLFVIIVGFATFLALITVVLGTPQEKTYTPAASAVLFYQPGDPDSDYMIGAVQLAERRRLPVTFVETSIEVPMLCFYAADGREIPESRMEGVWCLYDMSARFGIYPQGCEPRNPWATFIELVAAIPLGN